VTVTYVTREALLKPMEREQETVSLPELGEGVCVIVTGMTAKERSQFDQQFVSRKGEAMKSRIAEGRERIVVACCRDEGGKRIFTADDVAQLGKQSSAIIERIVIVAQRLSGMTKDELEDAVKNSEETPDV